MTSDAMAAYQQADAYAIKSDPEHGKLLKKVMGPSDVKMFIGGLSHETTTAKLWEYFAQYGEGTCSTNARENHEMILQQRINYSLFLKP